MIQVIDQISEIEEKYFSGDKKIIPLKCANQIDLLSERKLAELYSVPRAQVRQAIDRLVGKDYLYIKAGSGTYIKESKEILPDKELLCDMLAFSDFGGYLTHKRKVVIHGLPENAAWEKVIKSFTDEFPFIEIVSTPPQSDNNDSSCCDIVFGATHKLTVNHNDFMPIDIAQLKRQGFNEYDLCPEILKTCYIDGELLGIPILRTPSALYANTKLMKEYGIKEDQICNIEDLFKLADMVEEKSGGSILGIRYLGFVYHAALEGIILEHEDDAINFDSEKVKSFLEKLKPYIRKRHLPNPPSQLVAFINDKCLFYPDFLSLYAGLKKSNDHIVPIKIPRKKDGIFCECMYVGTISKNAKNKEEANLLLAYLTSKKAQEIFKEYAQNWLSVRNDVLEEQKRDSIFPKGTVSFDFNLKSHYHQIDLGLWNYCRKINIKLAKYFTNLWSLNETIEKLKYCKEDLE